MEMEPVLTVMMAGATPRAIINYEETGMTAGRMPSTSIVIVNRNGGSVLRDCIESVRRNTRDYEILLVDNASTDDSMRMVREGPDIRKFQLSSNVGHPKASNMAIRSSTGRYIVMMDPDTTFTPGWLDKLIEEANKSSTIGVVAPKLLRTSNPSILDSTGHIFQYQSGLALDRGHGELDIGQYDDQIELPSSCFACTLIKREVFEEIGLSDPHLLTLLSDVDFGLRANLAGWRVVYRPDSIVYHARGGSTKEPVRDRVNRLDDAYRLHMILKIYDPKNALLLGGRRFVMYPVRIAAGIRKLDLAYIRGNLRSMIWTIIHFPLRERVSFQRRRRESDRLIMVNNARS